ncbi:MAG: flagellar assembly protein FliW [Phycisphaeraceae bacterium]|nr:flagellar assembly protein FliW [Phycisphaeraceae bacterium]
MYVQTSRFGKIKIDDSQTLVFPKGLLGFPKHKRFVLLETGEDSYFWWLQSVVTPELAFVITDPSYFVAGYRVPIKADQMEVLGLGSLDDVQVFVIVNKHDEMLTGNLQGPLVVQVHNRQGEQLVLSDKRFTTRVPLVEIAAPAPVAEAMSA